MPQQTSNNHRKIDGKNKSIQQMQSRLENRITAAKEIVGTKE